MDLTYMPGELDHKNEKKNIKREHDSVDDFEHLDPDLSPVDVMSKKSVESDKTTGLKHEGIVKESTDDFFTGDNSKDSASSLAKSDDPLVSQKQVKDFMSDFDFGLQATTAQTDVNTKINPNGSDFGMERDFMPNEPLKESYDFNSSFITAEKENKMSKSSDIERDLLGLERNISPDLKHVQEPLISDEDKKPVPKEIDAMLPDLLGKDGDSSDEEFNFNNLKPLKAADALAQYDIKPEKSDLASLSGNNEKGYFGDSPKKEIPDPKPNVQHGFQSAIDNINVPVQDTKQQEDFPSKNDVSTDNTLKESTSQVEHSQPEKESSPVTPIPASVPAPEKTTQEAPQKSAIKKKASVSDLDDIIGPEDVFKRIGLDAWFTPERLHPKVEALVYWRDPKQSGIVFGSIMAILLSFCYMSLISVVAYFSLFALFGTICFRIYKTILQAIQKTNEGHPFKEYLELDLSLPQDKVREIVDTGVTHINAGIKELRRLFLVEDLIDSVKFAVSLWCLTFIGAIFNGMTLVILAFVALFTVPKIYENNQATIDQYIEVVRSKVAEITSKVKAALPIGKKEPEKDKEQ